MAGIGGRKGAESYWVVILVLGIELNFLVRQSIVNCCVVFWCQSCISSIFGMHCTQGNVFNHVYTVLDVFQGADSSESIPYGYLPTAHTCSNVLVLPIGFLTSPLPEEQGLFQVYDLAFANAHFGTM